jgi:hypothetical protein
MKALESIKGPIVIACAEYDSTERDGIREYYGLAFIEVDYGRPKGFEAEDADERYDQFYDHFLSDTAPGRKRYKEFDGYTFGIWLKKLYSPEEIRKYKTKFLNDKRAFQMNREPNGAGVLFHSALSFSRAHADIFYRFIDEELGIRRKSKIK